MAKSKSRRRKKTSSAESATQPKWGGHYSTKKRKYDRLLYALAAVMLVFGIGYYWWQASAAARAFQALAEQGAPALEKIKEFPSQGRTHLRPGQSWQYGEKFPTSGPHDLTWTRPGFYEAPQPPTMLVHAAEHGNVVIYYDNPGAETLEQLRGWADLYDGQWDGIVVTPQRGLGQAVVLTAWVKMLRQESFDPAGAAAFIDAFRGRGPEHPVR